MDIRSRLSLTVLFLYLLPAVCPAQEVRIAADTVLHNGRVWTGSAAGNAEQALAIWQGRVLAVGSDLEILAFAGPATTRIDLDGQSVFPGLADGHLHSKALSASDTTVDLTPVKSLAELLDALKKRIAASAPGEVIATNSDWHEAQLKELRLPTRWDLDPISPQNPVVVIRGGHEYILNSAALKKWNITRDTVSPPGGQITFDAARNDISGALVDRARDLVKLPPAPVRGPEERLALLKKEIADYNALGLTSIRIPGISVTDFKDYQELARRRELTARISVLIRWDRRSSAETLEQQIRSWAITPQYGDEWLRFDGIKLGVDGGYEGGWMTQPYPEPYGEGGKYFGLNTVPRDLFIAVVRMLGRNDMRPSTHAVGDAAVDLVLDAYEAADRENRIAGKRWVIEHAFITRPDQIERIRKLRVVISAQSHLYLAGASLLHYWGEARTKAVAPVREWLDAGIAVAGGTDNKLPYVPEAPLTTFYHWVTRDTVSGGILGPEHAISRREALRIATEGNAFLTFEEDRKGTLAPGMLADLVVLSEDILNCPDRRLRGTEVRATMVGGRFVFQSKEFAAARASGAGARPRPAGR